MALPAGLTVASSAAGHRMGSRGIMAANPARCKAGDG